MILEWTHPVAKLRVREIKMVLIADLKNPLESFRLVISLEFGYIYFNSPGLAVFYPVRVSFSILR